MRCKTRASSTGSRGRKTSRHCARIIEEALAKKDPREWEKILDTAGAPCASIWKVEEVIDHPQIAAREALQEIDTPYGRLRFAGSGFRLAHGGGRLDRMAPALSAHTDEVLSSIGYDTAAIADLARAGNHLSEERIRSINLRRSVPGKILAHGDLGGVGRR